MDDRELKAKVQKETVKTLGAVAGMLLVLVGLYLVLTGRAEQERYGQSLTGRQANWWHEEQDKHPIQAFLGMNPGKKDLDAVNSLAKALSR